MAQTENHADDIREGAIEFDPALIRELSEKLYPTIFDCIREYAANAWDADSERLNIYMLKKGSDSKIVIEDWGVGIEDLDRFWKIGMPIKSGLERTPHLDRPVIGSKGIGKLSYRKLGNKVELLTRTNQSAFYSTVDFDVSRYFVKEFDDPEEALSHVGTMAVIGDLEKDIKLKDIVSYCNSNLYGLILPGIASESPMSIYVNKMLINPIMPKGKDVSIKTKFGLIEGVLSPSDVCRLDVLLRGVKIKNINPDTTRPVSGYVNVGWLDPTTDRHDFVRDSNEYKAFYDSLRKFIGRNFSTQYEVISRKKRKMMRSLAKIMDEVIEEIGIFPENIDIKMPKQSESTPDRPESDMPMAPLPILPTNQPEEGRAKYTDDPNMPSPPYIKVDRDAVIGHPEGGSKRRRRPIKTKYGINWVLGQYGEDNPSVLVDQVSNIVIFNMENMYVNGIDDMSPKEQLFMMVHLYARGYALVLGQHDEIAEYQNFVDNVSSRLLSKVS